MTSLLSLPVLIVDCQTSTTQPTSGHLIELGWGIVSAEQIAREGVEKLRLENTFVGLPGAATLPITAARMTGIEAADLVGAPEAAEVWSRFLTAASGHVALAHYARFEQSFFKAMHEKHGGVLESRFACTYQIARQLLPGLTSASLRAVSGHLGRVLPEVHRTEPNLRATAWIWSRLAPKLSELGVASWEDLERWLSEKPPKRDKKSRLYLMPREVRLALPKRPGVYRMVSQDGKILYVGKATSLKDRVNSYFRVGKGNPRARMNELMAQVHDIRVTAVETSLEAALLETDEIKTWNPPYNSSLKSRKRSLTYCSDDFEEAYTEPGPDRPRGPYPSFHAFDQLNAISVAMSTNEDTFSVFYDLDSPEVLCEGLEQFASRHGFSLANPPRIAELLRLGTRLLALREKEESFEGTPNEEEDAFEDDASEEVWTAAAVCESAEKKARHAARLVRRSRWICRLADSTIAWRANENAPWRWIRFEEGLVVQRDYSKHFGAIPSSRSARKRIDKQRSFDVGMYDRMAVLIGEVRRLAGTGNELRIKLSPRRELSAEALLRRT